MLYLARTIFLVEEVSAEYIIADFAELCNKRFSNKSSCDAINDMPKFNFGCATHFFGEILRIEKEICIEFARVTAKMQSRKTD